MPCPLQVPAIALSWQPPFFLKSVTFLRVLPGFVRAVTWLGHHRHIAASFPVTLWPTLTQVAGSSTPLFPRICGWKRERTSLSTPGRTWDPKVESQAQGFFPLSRFFPIPSIPSHLHTLSSDPEETTYLPNLILPHPTIFVRRVRVGYALFSSIPLSCL